MRETEIDNEPYVLLAEKKDGEQILCDEFPNKRDALDAKLNPPMFTEDINYQVIPKSEWKVRSKSES